MKSLYTRKEAAELLGLNIRSIDRLLEGGELEKVVLTHRAIRITGRSIKKLTGGISLEAVN